MDTCNRCNTPLTDGTIICPQCGADQRYAAQPYSDIFLKVLCILTIIGASIGLLTIPFSLAGGGEIFDDNTFYIRLVIGALMAAGKLTGAILMLQKRLSGLYFYTVSAIVGILLSLWSAVAISALGNNMGTALGTILGVLSILPPVAFIIMYWLPVNRRLLK